MSGNFLTRLDVEQEIEAGPVLMGSRGPIGRSRIQNVRSSLTLTIEANESTITKVYNAIRATSPDPGQFQLESLQLPEVLAILVSELR